MHKIPDNFILLLAYIHAQLYIRAVYAFDYSLQNTALHVAAEHGQLEAVEILLEKGANVTLKNSHGKTPLCVATENRQSDIAIAFLKQPKLVQYHNKLFKERIVEHTCLCRNSESKSTLVCMNDERVTKRWFSNCLESRETQVSLIIATFKIFLTICFHKNSIKFSFSYSVWK